MHLGHFHSFMSFFGAIGKFITGSGLGETVYQTELCTSGSMNGLLFGKHYNMFVMFLFQLILLAPVFYLYGNQVVHLYCKAIVWFRKYGVKWVQPENLNFISYIE